MIQLSGSRDYAHLSHEYGGGVTIDAGDGTTNGRLTVDGVDVGNDVVRLADTGDLKLSANADGVTIRKGTSRVTFTDLADVAAANGLQVAVGDEIYTVDTAYDGGGIAAAYWWRGDGDIYYKPDTNLYIEETDYNRTYHVGEGSGRATIDNFNFGADNDVLAVDSAAAIHIHGDDLLVINGDGNIRVKDAAGKVLNVEIGGQKYAAELGRTLTYNNDAEYFGDLQGGRCAISVGADYGNNQVAVYLNEATELNGKVKQYVGVDKIDASAFDGQASLIGGELDDSIIAAQGDTSLWGGDGGDDTLVGAGSGNEFFYFRGNGNDVIREAASGDVVNLYDVTLDDIKSAYVTAQGAMLEFKDGGSVTFDGTAAATFKLGDGTAWTANHQTAQWQQA